MTDFVPKTPHERGLRNTEAPRQSRDEFLKNWQAWSEDWAGRTNERRKK